MKRATFLCILQIALLLMRLEMTDMPYPSLAFNGNEFGIVWVNDYGPSAVEREVMFARVGSCVE